MKVLKNPIPPIITHIFMDGKIGLIPLDKIALGIIFCFCFISCSAKENLLKPRYIKTDYCIVNDSYNAMHLKFKIRQDSVLLLYSNVIDNGNYLNDYDDTTDYAGFFRFSDIKDSSVTFKIKSYRSVEDIYIVTCKFYDGGNSMQWNVNTQKKIAYLPETAHFEYCKNEKSFAEVIVNRCPLYKFSSEESITKGYLVKGDYVEIIGQKGKWVNVKYVESDGKAIIRWIQANSIL